MKNPKGPEAAEANLYLSSEILRLREEAGLSQGELACRLGIGSQEMNRIESSSHCGYTLEILYRLANILGKRLQITFVENHATRLAEDPSTYGNEHSRVRSKNENDTPVIDIIAGSNGAGKTTFARQFLPSIGAHEFLNADLIAAGLSPLRPENSALAAGRLLLKRWRKLAEERQSFAFETTLSGRAYAPMLAEARRNGFVIRLHYLWIPSADIALRRIGNRVQKGGHKVPERDVRRRFLPSLRNFFHLYLPLADEAALWDVSGQPPTIVADWLSGSTTIHDPLNYAQIEHQARHR